MRKLITRVSLAVAFAASSIALLPAQTAKRPMSLDDLAKIKNVSDPQCSPDGKSVAFTVSMTDMKEDWAEHPRVAHQVATGWRDDPAQPAQERHRR